MVNEVFNMIYNLAIESIGKDMLNSMLYNRFAIIVEIDEDRNVEFLIATCKEGFEEYRDKINENNDKYYFAIYSKEINEEDDNDNVQIQMGISILNKNTFEKIYNYVSDEPYKPGDDLKEVLMEIAKQLD